MTSKKATPKKTDALTLRLNPKHKFLIELCSRQGHQSITVVVERAVRELSLKLDIPSADDKLSLGAALNYWWSPDESERIVNLVFFMPSLMTHEEACIKTVLIDAMDIFLNVHEIRSEQDLEYRSRYVDSRRGIVIANEEGFSVFVTPRRKHIKLCWDLITERAGQLAANGSYTPLEIEDVESFIGRPLSSIRPVIRARDDGYDDQGGGVLSFSRDDEINDTIDNVTGKS